MPAQTAQSGDSVRDLLEKILENQAAFIDGGGGGGGPVASTDVQFAATNRLLGRITSGAGAGEELTGAQVRTIAGLATSDTPTFAGLEGVANITGTASNMTITSGTGNSRTLLLRTTTSGGVATTALTLGADQVATFASHIISGTGSSIVAQNLKGVGIQLTGSFNGSNVVLFGSTGNGVLLLADSTVSDFNRIQLGGSTSAFPAIKRSATAMHIRLADDSAFAPLSALSYTSGAPNGGTAGVWKLGVSVTSGTSALDATGYVEIDIGGTLVKLARVTNS